MILKSEEIEIRSSDDVVRLRRAVRAWAVELGFGLVEQTKIVTAASELARNVIDYAGSGRMRMEAINDGNRRGLRLAFEDEGPGIPDVEQAMTDGYTTGGGLGLGLGGARRLSSEFHIDSRVGQGTRVTITRWR